MTPEKVRVASVGLGGWGGTLAEAAGRSGALEIVRCFDASEEARAAFAEKTISRRLSFFLSKASVERRCAQSRAPSPFSFPRTSFSSRESMDWLAPALWALPMASRSAG